MKRCLVLAITISIVACGGDSANPTAPGAVSTRDAVLSLTKGIASLGASLVAPDASLAFGTLPIGAANTFPIGNVNVSVDGTPVTMFALAQRVTYPTDTCLEALFGLSNFAPGSLHQSAGWAVLDPVADQLCITASRQTTRRERGCGYVDI